jgi:hypothetical protein
MRKIGIAALSWLVLMICACGSSQPLNINGFWIANLNNPDGTPAFGFTTNFMQGSGTAVNVTNLQASTPCFSTPTSETATFSRTGSSNGVQTGPFAMTISTEFPAAQNNIATLQGNRDAVTGGITGSWTMTGQSGCTGSGLFTMNQPPPV